MTIFDEVTVTIFDPTLVNVVKVDLSMSEDEIEKKLTDAHQNHDFCTIKTNYDIQGRSISKIVGEGEGWQGFEKLSPTMVGR